MKIGLPSLFYYGRQFFRQCYFCFPTDAVVNVAFELIGLFCPFPHANENYFLLFEMNFLNRYRRRGMDRFCQIRLNLSGPLPGLTYSDDFFAAVYAEHWIASAGSDESAHESVARFYIA